MRGIDTRNHIKQIALQLFAKHGVEGVSVRDILAAADQRSGGSLHYHFGGKDGLVHELVADGAQLFDEARVRRLDELEASDPQPQLRDILRILTDPFAGEDIQAVVQPGYLGLINSLLVDHYDALVEAVGDRDVGYRRCVEHIRALLPDIPRELLNQRIRLMMFFLFGIAASRERAEKGSLWARFWKEPASDANLLDCLEGMLNEPVSSETVAAAQPAPRRTRRSAAR